MNNKTHLDSLETVGAKRITTPEGTMYTIKGIEYPVACFYKLGEITVPLIDIPMMSDYKWQLECLIDRVEHPERYRAFEDVEATIEHLKKWLVENESKAKPTDKLYNKVFEGKASA